MARSVKLEIITPSKKFYQGEVELIIARTLQGEEGFMFGHSWACKLLDVGELWIQEKDASKNNFKVAAIAGGFIDIKDSIIIYTDAVEWPEDIDIARVNEEKDNAIKWLAENENTAEPAHIKKAKTAIAKAKIREAVAGGGGRRKN